MSGKLLSRCIRSTASLAFAALCLAPLNAIAGNLWLTGHDMDFHCAGGAGCNNFGIAVDFVRQGAPTKTLPILVLDEGSEVSTALGMAATKSHNSVEGAGMAFPIVVMSPSAAAFATATIDTATYSAIIIASDSACGGCDNNAASIVGINARITALQSFFTAGGGIMFLAGALDPGYYNSVPIPASAVAVSPPFTVTAAGLALGLTAADANCCATHNSFNLPPPGSSLIVAETDTTGKAETLVVSGGAICGAGICGAAGSIVVPTLSEWSMILMSSLLALSAVLYLRRRRQR